jgi:hypothetical protein
MIEVFVCNICSKGQIFSPELCIDVNGDLCCIGCVAELADLADTWAAGTDSACYEKASFANTHGTTWTLSSNDGKHGYTCELCGTESQGGIALIGARIGGHPYHSRCLRKLLPKPIPTTEFMQQMEELLG